MMAGWRRGGVVVVAGAVGLAVAALLAGQGGGALAYPDGYPPGRAYPPGQPRIWLALVARDPPFGAYPIPAYPAPAYPVPIAPTPTRTPNPRWPGLPLGG